MPDITPKEVRKQEVIKLVAAISGIVTGVLLAALGIFLAQ